MTINDPHSTPQVSSNSIPPTPPENSSATSSISPGQPDLAKTVVYRHPCECPTASRPLADGEEAEHRFDVDGEPFPWFITEAGASFTKHDGVYTVLVSIIMVDPETKDPIEFHHCHDDLPLLGGRVFPWLLTGPLIYIVELNALTVLILAFLAENVDADCGILDYTSQVDQ